MKLPKGINLLVKDFLSERDIVPASKKAYGSILASWVVWLTMDEIADVSNPTRQDVLRWKAYLLGLQRSDLTVESYMKVVGLFHSWLNSVYAMPNIAKGIYKRKKYAGYRKEHLSEYQVNELISTLPDVTIAQKRNKAIIVLMVSTGLRCVEVSRLCIDDLKRFDSGCFIKIQRKGHLSKDQTYCMGLNALAVIDSYLDERKEDDMIQPLFVNHGYHKGSDKMSPSSIGFIVHTQLNRIGLKGREYSAHSLRHTFAVLSYKRGVALNDISKALGHSSLSTTEIYLSSFEKEIRMMNPAVFSMDKMMQKHT